MGVFAMILAVFGGVAYLAVGLLLASALRVAVAGGMKWWQTLLVALLWPLAVFLPVLAFADWVRRGSH